MTTNRFPSVPIPSIAALSFAPPSSLHEKGYWVPTLDYLMQNNVHGADISTEYLYAIIEKAQPHHTRWTLNHLSREQLEGHLDALVEWWRKANPRRASLVSGEGMAEIKVFRERVVREGSVKSVERGDDCCCVIC
jgi:hypothetical protein